MINKLPRWVFTPASRYDTESVTQIEAIGKLQAKMNEVIDNYNDFVDTANASLESFTSASKEEMQIFETALRQEFQDFIDTVNIEFKEIEDTISQQFTDTSSLINNGLQEIEAAKQALLADIEDAQKVLEATIQQQVNDYITEHPELFTTVVDGSITEEKFTDELKHKTVNNYITPQMFGAVGDGVADDTEAIQAAFDYVVSQRLSDVSNTGDGNMYYGLAPKVFFPYGKYKITSPISFYSEYVDIEGDNAILFASCDKFFNINNGWYVSIKGLQFVECSNPITINGENTENGRVDITNCKFNNCMGASINIPYKQSYIGNVRDCHFFKSEYVISTEGCDLFTFDNCWISERTRTKDYDSSFLFKGSELQIKSCLFVPYPTTYKECCFIDGDSHVIVTDSHFGAESGSKPIIRAMNKNRNYSIKDCHVSYANYHSNALILISGGFNKITISNVNAFDDNMVPVRFSSDITTAEEKAAILSNNPFLYIDEISGNRKFPPVNGEYRKAQYLDKALHPYFRGAENIIKYSPNIKAVSNTANSVMLQGYSNQPWGITYPATEEEFCFLAIFDIKNTATSKRYTIPVFFTTETYGSQITFKASPMTNIFTSDDISLSYESGRNYHLYNENLGLIVSFPEAYSNIRVNRIIPLYQYSTGIFMGPATV